MLLVVQQWDWHVQQRRLHHLAVNHHKTRLLKAGKCRGQHCFMALPKTPRHTPSGRHLPIVELLPSFAAV
jgi:hypothetical protein